MHLAQVTDFSMTVGEGSGLPAGCVPCPQLQRLRLHDVTVQLEPADGPPGALSVCTALTALHLQDFRFEDGQAAFAAVAALPQLQRPAVELSDDQQGVFLLPALQHMSKLTHLSLEMQALYHADILEQPHLQDTMAEIEQSNPPWCCGLQVDSTRQGLGCCKSCC
jgi:hypothetical protein